jgi:hypothetical protein
VTGPIGAQTPGRSGRFPENWHHGRVLSPIA